MVVNLQRERTAAWAQLLKETSPSEADREKILELRQRIRERLRTAQGECGRGRSHLAALSHLAERSERLKVASELVREWVRCVDDVLALAERACAVASFQHAQAA